MECSPNSTMYQRRPRRLSIPHQEFSQPPVSLRTEALVPPPLFSKQPHTPPPTIFVAVVENIDYELCHHHEATSPTSSTAPPSLTWTTSSPESSAPNSPTFRTRPLSSASSSGSTYSVYSAYPEYPASLPWASASGTQRSLRRKPSPKNESLRSIRMRESDACLQRIYDQQTRAYLDGSILASRKPGSRLGIVWERQ